MCESAHSGSIQTPQRDGHVMRCEAAKSGRSPQQAVRGASMPHHGLQHNDAGWAGLQKGSQRASPVVLLLQEPGLLLQMLWLAVYTASVTAIEVPPTDLRAPRQRDNAGEASLVKLARGCGACLGPPGGPPKNKSCLLEQTASTLGCISGPWSAFSSTMTLVRQAI